MKGWFLVADSVLRFCALVTAEGAEKFERVAEGGFAGAGAWSEDREREFQGCCGVSRAVR
jgi:hypothetical protein